MNQQLSLMIRFPTVSLSCFIALVLLCLQNHSFSQKVSTVKGSLSSDAVAVEIERAAATLASLDVAVDLTEADKASLQSSYAEAIQRFKNAEGYIVKLANYRAVVDSAGVDLDGVKQQLANLPTVEQAADVPEQEDLDVLRKAVQAERSNVAKLNDLNERVQYEIAHMEARPFEIGARLPEAQAELSRSEGLLATVDSDLTRKDIADRVLWNAKREELTAEIAMLKVELNSQTQRGDLLLKQRELVGRQVENSKAALKAHESLLNRAQMSEADGMIADIAVYLKDSEALGPEVLALAEEVQGLAVRFKDTALQLREVGAESDQLTLFLADLNRDFTEMQKVIQLGGLDGILSQILVEQRRKLPNPRKISLSLEDRRSVIRRMRLDEFEYEQRLRAHDLDSARFGESSSAATSLLLQMRQELLNKLLKNQRLLVSLYSKVDISERNYLSLIVEVRQYLWEKLFWKKSSPALWSMESYDLDGAFTWLFGSDRFVEFAESIQSAIKRKPYFSGFGAIILLALLLLRARCTAVLHETTECLRHPSIDKFEHTRRAILVTILLALPVPLVLGYVAWAVASFPNASDWLLGVSRGLFLAFIIALWGSFLVVSCRPGGLCVVHFSWHKEHASKLRRIMCLSMLIGLPSMIAICSLLFDQNSLHFDVFGRCIYVALQAWIFVVLWWIFSPRAGIFAQVIEQHSERLYSRTKSLWFPFLLGVPVAMVLLAIDGYFITALVLSLEFFALLGIATLGSFCYFSVVRWFMIRERKFALDEALEARRIRLEQSALDKEDGDSADSETVEVKESELDLESVGKQTRRMMRSLFSIAVILSVWAYWTHTMPMDDVFDRITIGGWLNPFDLFGAVAIMWIITVIVKNLPGLLELAGLRASSIEVGTRYAITSISQYVLLAIGLAMVCNVMHINWSMFGWIATALSVGLGFGLQEVVANFVCGIILLFERPIRVGDVITINEVTGTVTQIRMRATTVINWDRQELVVPNKQFISDALINWTLTSAINRVVVEVGIAYGSDTIKAKGLLTEIAEAHPIVLSDPAPLATFEQFGDSSLNLKLRVYLPDLNHRIQTVTNLHDEISQRFSAAGIEIAFPQRDIHIRTVPETGVGDLFKPKGERA